MVLEQLNLTIVLSVFFPILIIFTILYALLQKSQVLGKSESRSAKRMNALVAISIATIVVVVNPLGVSWADIFGRIFGGSTILLIFLSFVVIFALMFSAARHETTKEGAPKTGWITIIIAIILAAVAISISGVIPVLTPPGLDVSGISEDYMPYIILGVFIALIIGIVFLFTKGD